MYALLITLTILIWGVWAFLGKLATQHNSAAFVTLGTNVGYFVFSLFLLIRILRNVGGDKPVNISWTALWPILLIGLLGVLAKWTFYAALERGPASPVIALTALYPIVAMALAFFATGEKLNRNQWVGLLIVCLGMVILLWGADDNKGAPEPTVPPSAESH